MTIWPCDVILNNTTSCVWHLKLFVYFRVHTSVVSMQQCNKSTKFWVLAVERSPCKFLKYRAEKSSRFKYEGSTNEFHIANNITSGEIRQFLPISTSLCSLRDFSCHLENASVIKFCEHAKYQKFICDVNKGSFSNSLHLMRQAFGIFFERRDFDLCCQTSAIK